MFGAKEALSRVRSELIEVALALLDVAGQGERVKAGPAEDQWLGNSWAQSGGCFMTR